ncbi:MAG: hypothetical protein ACXVCP_18925 [Bdellovibrio sp.]
MKFVNLLLLLSLFSSAQSFASADQYCGIKVEMSSVAIPSADFDHVLQGIKANLNRIDSEIKSYKTCDLADGSKVIVMKGDQIATSALIFGKKKNAVMLEPSTEIFILEKASIWLIKRPFLLNCNKATETCMLSSKKDSQWILVNNLYEELNAKGLDMPGLFEINEERNWIVNKLK